MRNGLEEVGVGVQAVARAQAHVAEVIEDVRQPHRGGEQPDHVQRGDRAHRPGQADGGREAHDDEVQRVERQHEEHEAGDRQLDPRALQRAGQPAREAEPRTLAPGHEERGARRHAGGQHEAEDHEPGQGGAREPFGGQRDAACLDGADGFHG